MAERIAPLEPRHGLALAGLLGEEITDGILIALLGRRRADVDALGMRRRDVEQLGIDEVIEDHHVGLLQAAVAAQRNEIRRAWPGADQVDGRTHG